MRAIDLVRHVSDSLGWGEIETIEGEQSKEVQSIVRASNLVLRSMQGDKNWAELKKDGTLVTQATSTGFNVVGLTQGSNEVSIALADTNVVGCLIQFEGYTPVYRITYCDETSLKLDRAWMDEDVAASLSRTIGRDLYEAPEDFDRIRGDIAYNLTDGVSKVDIVEEDDLGMIMGSSLAPEDPSKIYIGGISPRGRTIIQLESLPENSTLYRYTYQRKHPELAIDASPILYPDRYHQAIIDLVAARLTRDKDTAQKAQQQAADALQEKVRQHSNPSTSESRLGISPKASRRYRRRRY